MYDSGTPYKVLEGNGNMPPVVDNLLAGDGNRSPAGSENAAR